jgi:hypothetical protein
MSEARMNITGRWMAIAGACLSACKSDCLALPCPLPMALNITMTSSVTAGSVTGATAKVTGPALSTMTCAGSCIVPGYAGTYVIAVSAPGYVDAQRTVTVAGSTSNPACGCASVTRADVTFALVPSP